MVLEVDKKDPYNWSRESCVRFIEKEGRGLANAEDILPEGTGKTLVRLPEHEFLTRALRSGRLSEKQAKELYLKLWKRVVDARSRYKIKVKNYTVKAEFRVEVFEDVDSHQHQQGLESV